ncbi:MAG: hypothetical protein HQM14_12180 [SAR324 cluster bacterium]|nr:hypothetical protein [SAR324 cluster bacterium]
MEEKNKDQHLQNILAKIEQELDEEEAEEVIEALEELSASKEPLECFLKDPPLSFHSRFVVKHDFVLLLKPEKVAPFINEHSVVTIEYTDIDEKARHHYLISLKVIRPEVRVNGAQSAMICQIPKEFLVAHSRKRLLQRYSVEAHGWTLYFPKKNASFPVIDISRTGLSFRTKPDYHPWFPDDKIHNDVILKWESVGDVRIFFLRVVGLKRHKVSCRTGLNNVNMGQLNEWLKLIK